MKTNDDMNSKTYFSEAMPDDFLFKLPTRDELGLISLLLPLLLLIFFSVPPVCEKF